MALYLIRFDGQDRAVNAPSMTAAITAWRAWSKREWGDDWDGSEEPQQCALVSDEPVINGAPVICLCGSTRFKAEFITAQFRETMLGKIVLSVGWFGHADGDVYTPTETEKASLDALHKLKIDLADEILVVNVGGYVGDSTRSEIAHALATGKIVRYLSQETLQEGEAGAVSEEPVVNGSSMSISDKPSGSDG